MWVFHTGRKLCKWKTRIEKLCEPNQVLENCINFQSGSKRKVPDSNHTSLWKFSKENSEKPKFYCFLCSCLEITQAAGIPLFVHLKACSRVANGFLEWINNVPSKIIRSLDLKEVTRRRTFYSQTKYNLAILEERNCVIKHMWESLKSSF